MFANTNDKVVQWIIMSNYLLLLAACLIISIILHCAWRIKHFLSIIFSSDIYIFIYTMLCYTFLILIFNINVFYNYFHLIKIFSLNYEKILNLSIKLKIL